MKDKYDGATEVRVNKRGRLQVKNNQYNLPTANDLVYLDESPDYCLRNKTIGSFGMFEATLDERACFSFLNDFIFQILLSVKVRTAGRAIELQLEWMAVI